MFIPVQKRGRLKEEKKKKMNLHHSHLIPRVLGHHHTITLMDGDELLDVAIKLWTALYLSMKSKTLGMAKYCVLEIQQPTPVPRKAHLIPLGYMVRGEPNTPAAG